MNRYAFRATLHLWLIYDICADAVLLASHCARQLVTIVVQLVTLTLQRAAIWILERF